MVHGSSLGPGSDTLSMFAVDVVSDAELIRFVENLKKQVRILRLENEVLEASIMRLQPSLMNGVYAAVEYASKISLSTLSMEGTSRSRFGLTDSAHSSSNMRIQSKIFHRKLEPSLKPSSVKITRSIIGGTGPKINVEERLELVYGVMENQGNELKKFRSTAMKRHAYLKAQMEEIHLRTIDFEKWTLDFEQEVVIGGVEAMTKRIPAETWIRFMTEQGKKTDRQIDKMRLRSSTTNSQHRKLKEDIKRKKDLKSRLVPIDISVKEIEILRKLRILELKNNDLIELKAMTGDANLNRTMHKYDLMTLSNNLKKIKQLEIKRKDQTVNLKAEITALAAQVTPLEERLNWIQKLRKTYFVPDLLEYVKVKLEICELKTSIKRLETSLSIKQCALTNLNKRKSLTLSDITLLSKKNLKSKGKSTNTTDECEVPLRVTEFASATPKVCKPCGLLPRV